MQGAYYSWIERLGVVGARLRKRYVVWRVITWVLLGWVLIAVFLRSDIPVSILRSDISLVILVSDAVLVVSLLSFSIARSPQIGRRVRDSDRPERKPHFRPMTVLHLGFRRLADTLSSMRMRLPSIDIRDGKTRCPARPRGCEASGTRLLQSASSTVCSPTLYPPAPPSLVRVVRCWTFSLELVILGNFR